MTLHALPLVLTNAEKSFFQKKDVHLMLYQLQQMLYNCISTGQFTKLHVAGHHHYAKFPHCRIHVNGKGKWKINIRKLYGNPFRRLPKRVMNLFVVAANITRIVTDVANAFKYLFHVLHSVTVKAIVNVDYFSSLLLALHKK